MLYSKEVRFKTASGADVKAWSRDSGPHYDYSSDLVDPDSASQSDKDKYNKKNFHDFNELNAIAREVEVTSRIKSDKTIVRELNEDGTEKAYRD